MNDRPSFGNIMLVFIISLFAGFAVIAFFSVYLLIAVAALLVICFALRIEYGIAAIFGVAVGVVMLVIAFYQTVTTAISWLDPRTWFGGLLIGIN